MKRCFIALEPTEPCRRALGELAHQLPRCGGAAKIRALAPYSMHMTLKFLGPTPNEQIEELVMVMEHEAQPLPEPMLLAGLSAFPHPNRPRILFAPLATSRRPVQALMQRLENACETLGFARADREPVPHVTLARVQGPSIRGPLSELIERHQQQTWGAIDAASLILFESELHPEGARHTALARVPLGLARTAS